MRWWKQAVEPASTEAAQKPTLETAVGVLGALLAAGTIGFILWKGITETGGEPAVTISVTRVVPQDGVFLAEIEAFNGGDAAAAQLEVEGRLVSDGGSVETASTTFDYVPSHSRRRGGLFFSEDPRRGALTLAPKAFVQP